MDFVRRALFDKNAAIYEFLNREAVQSLVSEHLEGKLNRRLLIWSLLCVEQWCQTFLGGEPIVSPQLDSLHSRMAIGV